MPKADVLSSTLKKIFPYFLVIVACLFGYLLTKSFLQTKTVSHQFNYTTSVASEVTMVWGVMDRSLPPTNLWPANSYAKDSMVFTPLIRSGSEYYTTLKLKVGTDIYYWMVHKKDSSGDAMEIWDSGGDGKQYYIFVFENDGFLSPGYFIFLAGFLPLILIYLKNRNRESKIDISPLYSVKDYIPQLDSIRAIAVLLVIIHHWISHESWLNFTPNGPIGVNIFFVLSGFLITRILLRGKRDVEEMVVSKSKVFRNFYIRRSLRIFPIYYLLLVIFWFLNDPEIRTYGIYYFTYTTNLHLFNKEYFPGHVAHLWSLAVEEQFYLLWPWLIILVNKRILPYLVWLFLIIGISTNYVITNKSWWVTIFTPACFDAFAIGGLLAYISLCRHDIINFISARFKWILMVIVVVFILDVLKYSFFPARTIHSLLGAAMIFYCLYKKNNPVANFVLDSKLLVKLGKISYGIYLYHLFVPEVWQSINQKFNSWGIDLLYNNRVPPLIKPGYIFLQEFIVLIFICWISWVLIEKPMTSLKKYFA